MTTLLGFHRLLGMSLVQERIVAFALLVITGVAAFIVAAPTPAFAGTCTAGIYCGTIRHVNDPGYDPSIIVRCTYGVASSKRYVPEGRSSKEYCKDSDQVYVRSGEELWCRYSRSAPYGSRISYWAKTFDATGWHKITDAFNKSCTLRKD